MTLPPTSPFLSPPGECPCGSALAYADCCGALHQGAPAASAEALMRARYSAFVLGRADYLLRSWHVSTRPATLSLDSPAPRWLGLDIRRRWEIGPDAAGVEFVARFRHAGNRAVRQHERSRFLRERGHWYYVDAID